MLVNCEVMDSSRVLLAIREQAKWAKRKARIEERLKKLRARKSEIARQLEQVRTRIAQLSALGAMGELGRVKADIGLRIDGMR